MIIAKIGVFSWLVRVSQPWFCCVGVGVVFLKATSYVCPLVLLSLSCLPFCCTAPFFPSPAAPRFLESTFAIFVFALGRALRFISCFMCESCFFLSFLSLRKLWLHCDLKKWFREAVLGRRVLRNIGKSEGWVLL